MKLQSTARGQRVQWDGEDDGREEGREGGREGGISSRGEKGRKKERREEGREGGREGGRGRTLGGAVEDDPELVQAALVWDVDLKVAHHPEGGREGGREGETIGRGRDGWA